MSFQTDAVKWANVLNLVWIGSISTWFIDFNPMIRYAYESTRSLWDIDRQISQDPESGIRINYVNRPSR